VRILTVPAPIGVQYLALLAASLVVTFAVYGLLVRHSRLLRAALGMRSAAPHVAPLAAAAGRG
jgi:hypothetical protein